MGCEQRMKQAVPIEQEVLERIRQFPEVRAATVNGSESTHESAFMDLIRGNSDPGAILLRFAPDGVALTKNGKITYWDAKASDQIERTAYEVYMQYVDWGCRVLLFVKPPGYDTIYWQHVQNITFVDSREWVSKFANPFPVDADGWICPRRASTYSTNQLFSGTPYRKIDMRSMSVLSTG